MLGPIHETDERASLLRLRKLVEIANGIEALHGGRIHVEKINAPFLSKTDCKATGAEFGAGLRYAVGKGWLDLHEGGTFVRLLSPGDNPTSR